MRINTDQFNIDLLLSKECQCYVSNIRKGFYLQSEITGYAIEDIKIDEEEAENLASFCRSFLNAWEFARKQQGKTI